MAAAFSEGVGETERREALQMDERFTRRRSG
jgi:hypothetical protein